MLNKPQDGAQLDLNSSLDRLSDSDLDLLAKTDIKIIKSTYEGENSQNPRLSGILSDFIAQDITFDVFANEISVKLRNKAFQYYQNHNYDLALRVLDQSYSFEAHAFTLFAKTMVLRYSDRIHEALAMAIKALQTPWELNKQQQTQLQELINENSQAEVSLEMTRGLRVAERRAAQLGQIEELENQYNQEFSADLLFEHAYTLMAMGRRKDANSLAKITLNNPSRMSLFSEDQKSELMGLAGKKETLPEENPLSQKAIDKPKEGPAPKRESAKAQETTDRPEHISEELDKSFRESLREYKLLTRQTRLFLEGLQRVVDNDPLKPTPPNSHPIKKRIDISRLEAVINEVKSMDPPSAYASNDALLRNQEILLQTKEKIWLGFASEINGKYISCNATHLKDLASLLVKIPHSESDMIKVSSDEVGSPPQIPVSISGLPQNTRLSTGLILLGTNVGGVHSTPVVLSGSDIETSQPNVSLKDLLLKSQEDIAPFRIGYAEDTQTDEQVFVTESLHENQEQLEALTSTLESMTLRIELMLSSDPIMKHNEDYEISVANLDSLRKTLTELKSTRLDTSLNYRAMTKNKETMFNAQREMWDKITTSLDGQYISIEKENLDKIAKDLKVLNPFPERAATTFKNGTANRIQIDSGPRGYKAVQFYSAGFSFPTFDGSLYGAPQILFHSTH